MTAMTTEGLLPDTCPACGALPCDWVDGPFARPSTGDGAEARSISERARELLAAEYHAADLPYVFDLVVPNERDTAALRAIESALADRGAEG